MSDFGTINLDRGIFEHTAFRSGETFTEREAWIWMCCAATKSKRTRRVANALIHLERGQLAYSNRYMAKCWNWNVSRVQRYLASLVTESMIKTVTESDVTCVTIVNYDKWQTQTVGESGLNRHQSIVPSTEKPQDKPPFESPPNQIRETLSSDSRDSVVDVGVARARESFRISKEAFQLADDVMQTLGIDLAFVPPPWMGFAMWLQTGLCGGWRPDLVRIAAARIAARKHYELPFKYTYLEKPIQREHINAAQTHLPIPPVIVSKTQDQSHAGKTADSSTWQGRRDNFRRAQAELSQALDESSNEACGQGSGEVVQFASPTGRR